MLDTSQPLTHPDDVVSTTVFFGEVKKSILSKNFRGGTITNVFGRTSLDFSRADINGLVVIYMTQFCSEVRIRVPDDWHVVTDVSNAFVVVDDKRRNTVNIDKSKVLVLNGTGIFANVKIIPSDY
ncbi:MAG TPA: LiaF domain-containing protein [Mucilaginibacter sp.]|jgi:predicted membrane protein